MNLINMKEEIKNILKDYMKQINAYNSMLEKFCRNNLFHEQCGNKELNITGYSICQNKEHTDLKAGDDHACSCPFMNNIKLSQKQHKEMNTYETDPGTFKKPMGGRELKGI